MVVHVKSTMERQPIVIYSYGWTFGEINSEYYEHSRKAGLIGGGEYAEVS